MLQILRNHTSKFLTIYWAHSLIFLVVLSLSLTNIDPGTRSLSWDVMDSSFNPGLGISRSLTSTWQSFQGLGLLGGHGYVAQLPHAIALGIMSLIIPEDALRYVFAFLMLLSGGLGCYELAKRIGVKIANPSDQLGVQLASFLGALTYLLHFNTIQTFYVHLEPFIVMYGLLPWALLMVYSLFEAPTANKYLVFLALNFALSTIGFIPPVFISYLLFIGLACLTFLAFKPRLKTLRQIVLVTSIVLMTNLYWLTGVAFFTLTQPENYLNSKLNQLTTEEFILKNELYGTTRQLILSRSFYFDSLDQNRFDSNTLLAPVLKPWMDHGELTSVKVISVILFGLSLTGLVGLAVGLGRRRQVEFSIAPMALVTLAALGTGIPGLNIISALLRTIPFLSQAFRIPFSKLSMSMALWYALGISFSFLLFFWTIKRLSSLLPSRMIIGGVTLMLSISLIWYSWPAWQGHFLYAGSRVDFPTEYSQLFERLEHLPSNARIANFPILTTTGWNMHKWSGDQGYTGSGFYWYAVPHSFLDRAFDVWSPYNETYRNEMANAVYAQDEAQFRQVIAKYDVSHLLIDSSIYVADNPDAPLYISELKALIGKMPEIKPIAEFNSLELYEIMSASTHAKLYVPSTLNMTTTAETKIQWDRQFDIVGDHLSSDAGYSFPFLDLTKEAIVAPTFTDHYLAFTKMITAAEPQTFILPDLRPNEQVSFNIFALVENGSLDIIFQPILPEFKVNDKTFVLNQPQVVTFPVDSDVSEFKVQVNDQDFSISQSNEQQLLGQMYAGFGQLITVRNIQPEEEILGEDEPVYSNEIVLAEDFWGYYQAFGLPLLENEQYTIKAEVPVQRVRANLEQTIFQEGVNCEYEQKGSVRKFSQAGAIIYEAENGGAICDGVSLSQLPLDVAYLVRVKGRNESGLSPRFLIKNESNGRIINEQVLANDQFDQVFLIPPSFLGAKGLSLNWEGRSYGREKSINQIESIELYTLPLSTLAGSYLMPTATQPLEQTPTPLAFEHVGSGWYSLDATFESDTWVVLSEAYDPYWVAIDVHNWNLVSQKTLFNGWANAWKIPSGDRSIRFIYLPQLLTWLGYAALLLTGLSLLTWSFLVRKKP